MALFPLDRVCNASIDLELEVILEDVREDIVSFPSWPEDFGTVEHILEMYDLARPRLNVLAALLSDLRGARGADISTGLGFLPVILRRLGVACSATEKDVELAVFAVNHGVDVRGYTIGASQPPFPAASLDFLVFAEVLEHLKRSPVPVLLELASLLRPGGRFVLTTPNIARLAHLEALAAGENFLEPFQEEASLHIDATEFIEHVREYSIREVVEATEGAGLAVDRVLMTGWGAGGYEPLPNPWINEICVISATK